MKTKSEQPTWANQIKHARQLAKEKGLDALNNPHAALALPSARSSDDPLTAEPRVKGRLQCYALRQLAFQLALDIGALPPTSDEDTIRARAQSVSALIRAFSEADERARIARGRPLPGSLRPERKSKRNPKGLTLWVDDSPTPTKRAIPASTSTAHLVDASDLTDG